MPIYAKKPESNYTPPDEGLYKFVCVDVVDLGMKENKFNKRLQQKVKLYLMLDTEDAEMPVIGQEYTNSLHEKAKLRHHLEAWRGRKFTDQELNGFDLEKLIGASGQAQIVHSISSEGNTFANVQALVPLGKGMVKLVVPGTYVRHKDRDQRSNVSAPDDIDDDVVPF
jgi:hypothetical protein